MSRSAWKFTQITEFDLFLYFKNFTKKKYLPNYAPNIRAKSVNRWNYRTLFYISQGKYTVKVQPTIYHMSYKLGAFAKTRKPFFFRSKKKR